MYDFELFISCQKPKYCLFNISTTLSGKSHRQDLCYVYFSRSITNYSLSSDQPSHSLLHKISSANSRSWHVIVLVPMCQMAPNLPALLLVLFTVTTQTESYKKRRNYLSYTVGWNGRQLRSEKGCIWEIKSYCTKHRAYDFIFIFIFMRIIIRYNIVILARLNCGHNKHPQFSLRISFPISFIIIYHTLIFVFLLIYILMQLIFTYFCKQNASSICNLKKNCNQ